MIDYKGYELKEFKPSPDNVGFLVHKDKVLYGAVMTKANMWLGYVVDGEGFENVCSEEYIEFALDGIKAAYSREGDNVVDFLKYKERKSVC